MCVGKCEAAPSLNWAIWQLFTFTDWNERYVKYFLIWTTGRNRNFPFKRKLEEGEGRFCLQYPNVNKNGQMWGHSWYSSHHLHVLVSHKKRFVQPIPWMEDSVVLGKLKDFFFHLNDTKRRRKGGSLVRQNLWVVSVKLNEGKKFNINLRELTNMVHSFVIWGDLWFQGK